MVLDRLKYLSLTFINAKVVNWIFSKKWDLGDTFSDPKFHVLRTRSNFPHFKQWLFALFRTKIDCLTYLTLSKVKKLEFVSKYHEEREMRTGQRADKTPFFREMPPTQPNRPTPGPHVRAAMLYRVKESRGLSLVFSCFSMLINLPTYIAIWNFCKFWPILRNIL